MIAWCRLNWACDLVAALVAVLALAALLVPTGVLALERGPVHQATVLRVLDGDTIEVEATIWPDITVRTMVRIWGIDTPELRSAKQCEKDLAQQAKAMVERLLEAASNKVTLLDIVPDKYGGRVVAQVALPGGDLLATLLLEAGLAHPYLGGTKTGGWCA